MTFARRVSAVLKRLVSDEARTIAGRCKIARALEVTLEEAESLDAKLEAAMQHAIRSEQAKAKAENLVVALNAENARLEREATEDKAHMQAAHFEEITSLTAQKEKADADKAAVDRAFTDYKLQILRERSEYLPDDYTTPPEG